MEDGKIVAVGPLRHSPPAPRFTLAGKTIIPGLVDTRIWACSRPMIPNSDGNKWPAVQTWSERLDPNPFDPGIRMANAGGVTTANIAAAAT